MKCYIYLDFREPICDVPLSLHQVFRVFVCKVCQSLVGIFDNVVSSSSTKPRSILIHNSWAICIFH